MTGRQDIEEWYRRLGKAKPESPEWYEIASMMENDHVRTSIVNRKPDGDDKLLELAREALRAAQHSLGEKHPRAAEAMQNLGFYYLAVKEDQEKALDYLQRAAALAGARNPALAATYVRAGIYLYEKRDVSKAEEAFEEALAIQRADPNVDPEDLAHTLFLLSYPRAVASGPPAALELTQEALDVLQKAKLRKSPLLANIKERLEDLRES